LGLAIASTYRLVAYPTDTIQLQDGLLTDHRGSRKDRRFLRRV
jgi:hypothetical protein